jgi:hypothetical protein
VKKYISQKDRGAARILIDVPTVGLSTCFADDQNDGTGSAKARGKAEV